MRRPLILAALALILALPLQAADPKPVQVEDLAWIAGRWTGTVGDDPLEEQWNAPAGGTMIGMFRWMKKDGTTSMFEILTIEPGPQGPVYHLRHFGPGLIAWEEKDAPYRCPLAASGPREVTFACEGKPSRFTFRRTSETTMTVIVEGQRDGKARTMEFLYTLAK